MNQQEEEQIKQLLQGALPRMEGEEPARDLWPAMLRRIEARPVTTPWFDAALAGGLAALALCFPMAIPVILYYL